MKAAVFESKETIVFRDFEDPVMGDNDILVKVKYCGICGTDVAFFKGIMSYLKMGLQKYPFVPGHEWSGIVADIGKNVKSIKIGDRVTGDVSVGCGKCPECMDGNYHICTERYEVGNLGNKPGAMAEYIVMPERNVYKLPDNVSFIAGAIVEPLATAVHGFERKKIDFLENILITGTGLIGILAAQVGSTYLSTNVVLTGRTEEKLNIAKECGIKNAINIKEKEVRVYLEEMGILNKISFCIECSGNIYALKQCLEFVKSGGHISIIGFYENYKDVVDFDIITTKNLEIHGVLASPNCFNSAILLLEKGLVNYNPLISKIFPLNEINHAINYLLDKKNNAIKVMLKVSD